MARDCDTRNERIEISLLCVPVVPLPMGGIFLIFRMHQIKVYTRKGKFSSGGLLIRYHAAVGLFK